MATGAQAIEKIAEVTGLLPSTVDRLARALKQSGRKRGGFTQWPRGDRGGGKNSAHVWPVHLVNMAFGLAFPFPTTVAPDTADELGDLACVCAVGISAGPEVGFGRTTRLVNAWKRAIGAPWPDPSDPAIQAAWVPLTQHPAFRVLPGATLREALVNLIDWLSRPEGRELYASLLDQNRLSVEITREESFDPQATITYTDECPPDENGYPPRSDYFPRQLPLNANWEDTVKHTPATIQRTARLNSYLFLTMADLWADTRARTGVAPRPLAEPTLAGVGDDADPKHAKAGGMAVPPAQRDGQLSGQPTSERIAQRDSEHPIKTPRAKQRALDLAADRTPQRDLGGSERAHRFDDGNRARQRLGAPCDQGRARRRPDPVRHTCA